MYDTIIVGAGPAGLTAAIYLCRAGKKVLVLEAKSYGGSIINTLDIENYPGLFHVSGFDFADNLYNQAKDLGTEFRFEKVINILDGKEKKAITSKNEYNCKTIILATGSINRKLGLEKEEELIGRGISYCATCDGAFYKGKTVAVIGGGNTALEDALYLSDIASKVYLIHRRDEFRGDDKTVNILKSKNNLDFIYNSNIIKLYASDRLNSIDVSDSNGKITNIKVDGVFVAIGRIPENDSFKDIIKVDESGYVISNEDCKTNIDGIFVAGDNREKEVRQLVTATSDGAIAAMEVIKYLRNE